MSTYFVVNATITDPELLTSYLAAAPATFAGHDLKVLVAADDAETIEGEPAGHRVVVLEFPDREAFHAWYHSPAYRAIIGMRADATEGFAVLVDGR